LISIPNFIKPASALIKLATATKAQVSQKEAKQWMWYVLATKTTANKPNTTQNWKGAKWVYI